MGTRGKVWGPEVRYGDQRRGMGTGGEVWGLEVRCGDQR